MLVEPGTYIVASAGYVVTTVVDKKSSGPDGFAFVILDAGMETITRPLLYGSRHPLYVVARDGRLLSSEFAPSIGTQEQHVVVGRCCESGDAQTIDAQGNIMPRAMADAEIGDHVVIGGAGAYCSSMSLTGYNSYPQAAEVLVRPDGSYKLIRERQTLAQLTQNELAL
jgi:diaminopimelate decarboxylase